MSTADKLEAAETAVEHEQELLDRAMSGLEHEVSKQQASEVYDAQELSFKAGSATCAIANLHQAERALDAVKRLASS